MINEVIELLEKYCDGKGNIDKVEISVLQLHRIIKALKQQPCEDAVSREAVLDEISDYNNDLDYTTNELYDRVKQMSSVNPQPKIGHWIKSEGYDDIDHFYICSECGRYINLNCGAKLTDYQYCHCGAKMVEPQESEDKK